MKIKLSTSKKLTDNHSICFLTDQNLTGTETISGFSKHSEYLRKQIESEQQVIELNEFPIFYYMIILPEPKNENSDFEKARSLGSQIKLRIKIQKTEILEIINLTTSTSLTIQFVEGLALSNYSFTKYFKEPEKKQNTLKEIIIVDSVIKESEIEELKNLVEAVFLARDLGNEPYSTLNTKKFIAEIKRVSEDSGFKVEILEKKQIESLKMGGLSAVNQGSDQPPFFGILEWKPENAVNQKPIVLVGKGIMYDTGGYSLKPTNSMDTMKSDMCGAADVLAVFSAVAKSKLPIYIIGLIPSTDNALSAASYRPGDVIRMHNGLFVEVLNTDAEGRLILADALSYAQKYEPELVMDFATLTGAAAAALGEHGTVVFGKAEKKVMEMIRQSSEKVYERIVEFPLWDEYDKLLKSEIADLKNIGGSEGGAITAAKFLERFTAYPWIHFDIAGPSFIKGDNEYKIKGATGVGVRLMFDFLKTRINQK
jgi:leucyl aminopeptidase